MTAAAPPPKAKLPRISRLPRLPALAWIVLGFFASYLLFFLWPTFGGRVMAFPVYLDAIDPIGWDLSQMLSYSRNWLAGGTPYIGENLYPPLATMMLSPLTLLDPKMAYRALLTATVLAYTALVVLLPSLFRPGRPSSAVVLLFAVTGLISYPLQFELERGQFNVLASACLLLGVYLFHRRPHLRLLSYVLFVISVQLKVYPLALLPLFVDDWSSWRSSLPRLMGLIGVNIACLLALGPRTFADFVPAIQRQLVDPGIWIGNHSAKSFAEQAAPAVSGWIQAAILGLVGACLAVGIWRAIGGGRKGPDSYLALTCMIAALIVPSVSHDYTLSLLAAPAVAFLTDLEDKEAPATGGWMRAGCLVAFGLAYSALLVSYTGRVSLPGLSTVVPAVLTQNALPFLLLVLLSASGLALLERPRKARGTASDRLEP